MTKNPPPLAVIGSGIAGLSAAIRLAVRGKQVVVFEQNSYTGGKVTAFEKDGYRFDMGPSLFTMPHLVEELFEIAGKDPKEYFQYYTHDEVCRYFWLDGTRLTLFPSIRKNKEAIENVFGEESGRQAERYFEDARQKFELTAPFFLEQSLHKAKTFLTPNVLKVIAQIPRLGLLSTLNEVNKGYFNEPKLVQLFNRYATYNGSSPYKTPGIMQMISHLEHGMGTHFPKGGMHAISQSLTRLALDLGVKFELNSRVNEILTQNNRITGINVNGKLRKVNTVVCNSDVKHVYSQMLPDDVPRPKKILDQEPSSSALIFYWGVGRTFPELDLHNIIFSENYELEFARINSDGPFWEDPTIYIHISNRLEISDAPQGKDSWFVMVNVPYDRGQNWDDIIQKLRVEILQRISHVVGTKIEPLIESEEILTPREIQDRTSSVGGALYGTSSNDRMAAFLRQANKCNSVKGLYYCGGSAHPGGGVPLCILSGKIAAEWIEEDE